MPLDRVFDAVLGVLDLVIAETGVEVYVFMHVADNQRGYLSTGPIVSEFA
ncbi:hypothetical protein GCM10027578_22070 [Spirosoma luteolum]